MRVKTVLVALGCALVALAPVAALAKPSPTKPKARYYLALGDSLARAVARICQWTWMCAPAPRGPNIHANATGYKQLAKTFKKSIL